MFPWQFQKHPLHDELQMLSRCALKWATLVGLDRSTPPLPPLLSLPPFRAKTKPIYALLWRWRGSNMVRCSSSPYGGCKEFLSDSAHALYIHCDESPCAEWVSFSLSDTGWLFPLNCKNAVDHKLLKCCSSIFFFTDFVSSKHYLLTSAIYSAEWIVLHFLTWGHKC